MALSPSSLKASGVPHRDARLPAEAAAFATISNRLLLNFRSGQRNSTQLIRVFAISHPETLWHYFCFQDGQRAHSLREHRRHARRCQPIGSHGVGRDQRRTIL
jgi:hypothetical protein